MFAEKIFAIAHYADQVVLIILIIMSVLSVGMIFERFMALKRISEESSRIRLRIKLALQTNSLQDFEDLAKDPSSIEGRAANQSMKHIKESGLNGFEEVFNTFILIEKPDLEKYLAVLATIASNAPFIGLLGTVLGIMKAFNDLAQATDAGQQTVMAGISVALVATAAGLFVAIPAGIFYNYFTRKVKGIMGSLESVKELGLAYGKKKGL
ncbi:MAG: tolQ protein [Bdellovibrionales bacterium RIFCSPHIGHO2_01_FULL_40_29]|nr:MAG: tolQ protein [Bdellovibrionales bacterium RIFCSPHIGHO2_01_FULL_40_29]OFZ35404.1 MAG: tolQ protein [Bdellovibrionales bacterium RIFCSPHIGHO2_02_FULL_40_15]